jgi:hypothetical protein
MEELPTEILLAIYELLPMIDQQRLRITCKTIYQLFPGTTMNLYKKRYITNLLEEIANMQKYLIKIFRITHPCVGDQFQIVRNKNTYYNLKSSPRGTLEISRQIDMEKTKLPSVHLNIKNVVKEICKCEPKNKKDYFFLQDMMFKNENIVFENEFVRQMDRFPVLSFDYQMKFESKIVSSGRYDDFFRLLCGKVNKVYKILYTDMNHFKTEGKMIEFLRLISKK